MQKTWRQLKVYWALNYTQSILTAPPLHIPTHAYFSHLPISLMAFFNASIMAMLKTEPFMWAVYAGQLLYRFRNIQGMLLYKFGVCFILYISTDVQIYQYSWCTSSCTHILMYRFLSIHGSALSYISIGYRFIIPQDIFCQLFMQR